MTYKEVHDDASASYASVDLTEDEDGMNAEQYQAQQKRLKENLVSIDAQNIRPWQQHMLSGDASTK